MKNIYFIIAIISVSFISCEGRMSKNQSLKEDIKEFSNRNSSVPNFSIEPESYVEIITDTIIGDTFKANIRNSSLMGTDDLVKSEGQNSFRRKFVSEISLAYQNKNIFTYKLNVKNFILKDGSEFWRNATFEHAWVDQELSTAEHLVMKFSFIDPKSKFFKLYELKVDQNGKYSIILLEEKLS